MEKAQPPETDHESARWPEIGIRHDGWPARFGRQLSEGGALRVDYGSSTAIGLGARVTAESIEFWLLIHTGLRHERRGGSLLPYKNSGTKDPLTSLVGARLIL